MGADPRQAAEGQPFPLEDFEGGKVCNVMLTADQTIGDFVFKRDSRCMKAPGNK
jgi:hypothetical protein